MPTSRRRSRRATHALLVCTLALGGLTACFGSGPDDVAAALAAGLASGDLAEVPMASGTPAEATKELTSIRAGLGELRPKVTVASVGEATKSDDGAVTAEAVLTHSWTIPTGTNRSGTWTYETRAELSETDDGWAVHWAPSVEADIAAGETLSLSRTQPPRADVLGAGAITLVTNRPVSRFGIDKGKLAAGEVEASARALATLVGVDPDSYASRAVQAGDRQFVEAIVFRADQVPQPVRDGYGAIPGAVIVGEERALAPSREFARPILGSVGEVTAELIDKDPTQYVAGDVVGLSGLQQRYEQRLGGTPGVAVLAAREGGQSRTMFQVNAEPGQPVTTTLDQTVQNQVQDSLAGVTPASAVVVIRASTGEVVAAASGPGSDGYSTSTLGRYAPGSTFKVVTSLALLRKGLTPDSQVDCPATITVDGRTFSNYSDFPANRVGPMTLRDALALSCNTAFIGAGETHGVTAGDLATAAASLGIGWDSASTGADVFSGSVPAEGSKTEIAAARIGQGKVTASPLAMATVAASVVRGSTVVPRLVTDPTPTEAGQATLTSGEADALRSMMAGVVTGGTGSVVAGVPGPPVIAKTGTAEYGEASPPATRAWMIAGRGDYAVAVFVAEGASGSHTAGPIMADVLAKLPAD